MGGAGDMLFTQASSSSPTGRIKIDAKEKAVSVHHAAQHETGLRPGSTPNDRTIDIVGQYTPDSSKGETLMINSLLSASVLTLVASVSANTLPPPIPTAVIETSAGDITVQLHDYAAPITVANFMAHAQAGHFDNGSFYRVVRNDNERAGVTPMNLIQGGHSFDGLTQAQGITHEPTAETGLTHRRGAISMARDEVGTATTEFFIMLNDYPGLDSGPGGRNPDEAGYAVFGYVVEGIEVVEAINAGQASADRAPDDFPYPQFLDTPVVIETVRIISQN